MTKEKGDLWRRQGNCKFLNKKKEKNNTEMTYWFGFCWFDMFFNRCLFLFVNPSTKNNSECS